MSNKIIKLNEECFSDFVSIIVKAYPGVFSPADESKKNLEQSFCKIQSEEPYINFYGLYKDEKLLGGMRLHDYVMRFLSTDIGVGGISLVAVDLLHKKEKVCKDIISYSLKHFKEKGYCMAMLYPFRPEFYKKMGFGYGTKINQHRIKPNCFPKGNSKKHIEYLGKENKAELQDCYNRYISRVNGMVKKSESDLNGIFNNTNNVVVAYKDNGIVQGYIVMRFVKTSHNNSLLNDIFIDEFVYENKEALIELTTFLNSQSDQIREIIYNTQDEYFHYLLTDSRNGSLDLIPHVYHESNIQGVGLMYRIIDIKAAFNALCDYNFGGQSCRLKLKINDSFFEENNDDIIVHFDNGKACIAMNEKYDAEVSIDISEFSSLLMGVINFKSLYKYGLADISDKAYIDTVNRIFATDVKPMCIAKF